MHLPLCVARASPLRECLVMKNSGRFAPEPQIQTQLHIRYAVYSLRCGNRKPDKGGRAHRTLASQIDPLSGNKTQRRTF
jgi:hypothetical protein